MQVTEPTGVVERSTVRVFLDGSLVGTCRFVGRHLAEYQGRPLAETPEAHEAALQALAERLLAQAREELLAMQQTVYEEESMRQYSEVPVDIALIRWTLSLTPLERLYALDARRRSVSLDARRSEKRD